MEGETRMWWWWRAGVAVVAEARGCGGGQGLWGRSVAEEPKSEGQLAPAPPCPPSPLLAHQVSRPSLPRPPHFLSTMPPSSLSSHATPRRGTPGTPPWRSRLGAAGGRQPSDCPRHASLSRRFGRQPRQQPGPGAAREALTGSPPSAPHVLRGDPLTGTVSPAPENADHMMRWTPRV
ncbi:hypothetical protein E2C01_029339 [Portunus trituberculatus]|uniref:Uncharacterized protein n=1 Tax=Portunus trituberculatus TaxID=210409 RepID=A0A5B7EP01_PORTR|nr:hypothetical protein [Portunus trituberculatus]